MKEYFLIYQFDKDHATVEHLTKEELLKRLGEDFSYLTNVNEEEMGCWGENYLIVKGKIITTRT